MCWNGDDFASLRSLLDINQPVLHVLAKEEKKIKEHIQNARNSWADICIEKMLKIGIL